MNRHQTYYLNHREEILAKHREYYKIHKEQYNQNRKKYPKSQQTMRMNIIELLGNKCSNPNCLVPNGCSDWRALQIDHINGKGNKEFQQLKNTYQYYKFILEQIKSGSKEYQLLCANCNWIKKYENKET